MTCDLANPIFTDEAKATAHMEADRWPDGANCPHCGSLNVHKMAGKTQAGMFLCNDCREKFTVRTGSIFERSHIPLHKWLLATHLMAASKKGISALQLSRMLGLPYKSAWFLCHRNHEARRHGAYRRRKQDCRGGRKFHRRQGKEPRLCQEGTEKTRRSYPCRT